MDKIAEQLKAYIDTHPFDPGDSDCETVMEQLYFALPICNETGSFRSEYGSNTP